MRLGPIDLSVTDLDRSVAWYQDVLGLRLIGSDNDAITLGAGEQAGLVVLHEDPGARRAGRHAGLFHLALLHPSREELAHAALRLAATSTPIEGTADHGVSEALYLSDPDGNGIELYADRPREQWPSAAAGERVRMFTAPLDLDGLIGAVNAERPRRHSDEELSVGHVHLHVGDIAEGLGFYRDALGFELMATLPGAAFLSAGGYHHHLGINVWRGGGVPPAPPGTVGLRCWTVVLPAAADIAAAGDRVRAAGFAVDAQDDERIVTQDPWNNALLLTVRADAAGPSAPTASERA